MATVRRLYGASLTIYFSLKQVGLDGVKRPLDMTGKVVWVRRLSSTGVQPRLDPIPDATVTVAAAQDIAALAYDGDKTAGSWVVLFLPGGEAPGSFAMTPNIDIALYVGSSEGSQDAVPSVTPFSIQRITTGNEGVF